MRRHNKWNKKQKQIKWFEQGEKSTKSFLNLEKHRAYVNQIRGILFGNREISNHTEIIKTLHNCMNVFSNKKKKHLKYSKHSKHKIKTFSIANLNGLNLPKPNNSETKLCDGSIAKK